MSRKAGLPLSEERPVLESRRHHRVPESFVTMDVHIASCAEPAAAPRVPGIRVLHVIPSVATVFGGPSQAIRTMERVLSSAAVQVTTVTTDDDGPGRRCSEPDCSLPKGANRRYFRKWTEFYKVAPGMVPWVWRYAREFDVVHIHALFSFTSVAAAAICSLRGVPYIVRPLGTLNRYGVQHRRPWLKRLSLRWIEGPLLACAACVHFTSQAELEQAKLLGIDFKAAVIPLGVERVFRDPAHATRPPENAAGGTILYLSRIDPKKNLEALLVAFSGLLAARPGVELRIAGSGPESYVAALKHLSRTLGIEDHVRWLGHVTGAGKAAAFSSADVFVLPSFSENFGIAAVEALAAGLPCVLAKGVAIAGDVEAAGAGRAVVPGADAIQAALLQILEHPEDRVRMANNACDLVERAYSADAMARRLLCLYQTLRRGDAASGGER